MELVIALSAGLLGIVVAALMANFVLKQPQGVKAVRDISAAIKEGALAFLGREYRILAIFVDRKSVV